MTIKQYEEDIRKEMLDTLGKDTEQFFNQLNVEKRTRDYWLLDVKNALIPSREPVYKLKLHGFYLEVWLGELECMATFGCEILNIGGRQLTIQSYEEAIATLRYFVDRLPGFMEEYRKRMDVAELEVQKFNMVSDICVATAKSQLDGALKPGDLSSFRFTPTRGDIMVKFLDRRTDRIRMFRLRYDRLADDIGRVKTWYNTQGPGGDKDYLSRCAIALPCTM